MKNNQIWLFVGLALIIGLLVGLLVSRSGHHQRPVSRQAAAPAAAVDFSQNINLLKEMVTNDPQNRGAWVQLGNNYFDSKQPMKAVEAYNKALAIDGKDPAVLTDQGVMFRRLGWYDRAVENFAKALKIDPTFKQSLYNLGIVYRYDLKDFAKARDAWQRYLKLDPDSASAEAVRKELAAIKAPPTK